MKTFKFDQHELGMYEPDDRAIDYTRKAARAVLKNDKGQIAVMYFTTTGSYKLPGGGIDDGESTTDGLIRELREETGYEVQGIHELCNYEEWRYFCGMHQISYCFTATAGNFLGTELTAKEQSQGMELRWASDYDQAINWIKSGHNTDDDGSETGLAMMILRDTTILEYAKQQAA